MRIAAMIFLEDANLSRSHFADVIGLNRHVVMRYFKHEELDPKIVEQITDALIFIRDGKWVWPDIRQLGFGDPTQKERRAESDIFDKEFKKTYKKALKKRAINTPCITEELRNKEV